MRLIRTVASITLVLLLAGGVSSALLHSADASHSGLFAETPTSREAVVFSTDPHAVWDSFRDTARKHQYAYAEYLDPTGASDDLPYSATVDTFLEALVGRATPRDRGLLYIFTHGVGGEDGCSPAPPAGLGGPPQCILPQPLGQSKAPRDYYLLAEVYSQPSARNRAFRVYGARKDLPFHSGELIRCDWNHRDKTATPWYGICIRDTAIRRLGAGRFANSIVHVAACSSFLLADDFAAREYFGYRPSCPTKVDRGTTTGEILHDTKLLWGRMNGDDKGSRRAARSAFGMGQADGFTSDFDYQPGAGDTVLSPSVLSVTPATEFDGSAQGEVRFDTPVVAEDAQGKSVPLDKLLTMKSADGCDAKLSSVSLNSAAGVLAFEIKATTPGTAELTVHAENARAGTNFRNVLDGDEVGPNGDDYVWSVRCDVPLPTLTLDDVIVTEGDSGTTGAQFTVSLSRSSDKTVSVNYSTADDTATAPADYAHASGTLRFDPEEKAKPITVAVRGDTDDESDEKFLLDLSDPEFATLADDHQGSGIILDDDTPEEPPVMPPDGGGPWGEPHVISLDKLAFDFQATGEYVLTRSVTPGLTIHARFGRIGSPYGVSINRGLAVRDGTDLVTFSDAANLPFIHDPPVHVNGSTVTADALPIDLPGGGRLEATGDFYFLTTRNGTVVTTDRGRHYPWYVVAPAPSLAGAVEGLLGNFDGDPDNDLPDDDVYGSFGAQWRVPPGESLFTTTQPGAELFPSPTRNVLLTEFGADAVNSALGACRGAGVDPAMLEDCAIDVLATGDADAATAGAAAVTEVAAGTVDHDVPPVTQHIGGATGMPVATFARASEMVEITIPVEAGHTFRLEPGSPCEPSALVATVQAPGSDTPATIDLGSCTDDRVFDTGAIGGELTVTLRALGSDLPAEFALVYTDVDTARISVASDGTEAGPNSEPAVSADGHHIAFTSFGNSLVSGDTNETADIFLRDTVTATTSRASVASDGTQANPSFGSSEPAVSADGRHVAFRSWADNLVFGDTNGSADIFVRDTVAATTRRVSVASDGSQATFSSGGSFHPAISADGRLVAFSSWASLVPGDTNQSPDVFAHDTVTGITRRVSVASDGTQANFSSGSFQTAISADGRHVAFRSAAQNLVPADTNQSPDVFVHDTVTGTTRRISVASDGAQAVGESSEPAISADGRHIAFRSYASNLVPGDTNQRSDVFVHDTLTGTTRRISVASDGAQADGEGSEPAISADGSHLAFRSSAPNLTPGDTNDEFDVFVHDTATARTRRVSISSHGTQANGESADPAISADGRSIAFRSSAQNLVPGDTNSGADVFLYRPT